MFTGLIETIGTIAAIHRQGENLVFRVKSDLPTVEIKIGDSIALDGYCQTVVSLAEGTFEVEVGQETLAVTTAKQRRVGDRLNLERAMRLGDRLGGHLVAGHVDGVGAIRKVSDRQRFYLVELDVPAVVLHYCVPKGSIAVDGISLTINGVTENGIELGIIPHTWSATTLRERKVGDSVNLEADMIGKYIERFVLARQGGGREKQKTLDEDFLVKHGFWK